MALVRTLLKCHRPMNSIARAASSVIHACLPFSTSAMRWYCTILLTALWTTSMTMQSGKIGRQQRMKAPFIQSPVSNGMSKPIALFFSHTARMAGSPMVETRYTAAPKLSSTLKRRTTLDSAASPAAMDAASQLKRKSSTSELQMSFSSASTYSSIECIRLRHLMKSAISAWTSASRNGEHQRTKFWVSRLGLASSSQSQLCRPIQAVNAQQAQATMQRAPAKA
mmetsp:Transcript_131037/g.407536  ORF Transcript_131037/g.407536 Transcript_131037/m.407536 type:complete len:224 (+) Transcript_131037:1188-1859(+)